MRKLAIAVLGFGLSTGLLIAQSENAAELATQNVTTVNKVLKSGSWTNVLSADFKKPGKKDMFIAVSLECGLFTGNGSDAPADAAVAVRVFVDGNQTRPGVVHYCGKTNGLVAPFSGLSSCSSSSLSSCGFSSADMAEIGRNLRSQDFNFLLINIPKGIQHIAVQATVQAGPTASQAFGVIGHGSVEASVVNLKEEATQ
jgi:hypothetical protein